MKPMTLTMTAFGPFPDTVHLDFSSLGTHKIFLITGPTGAGKTTILDGIVYALYGRTSGGYREGATMRSDYAEPSVITKVEYVFAIGKQRYKIERTPKQIVKKLRGEGTREVTAKVSLSQWKDNDWVLLSSRSNDVKATIESIIGFRADQFLQVVLLPQGEFRKLLLAKTSEREDLFHSLFQTYVYRSLQNGLKERLGAATEAERRHVEAVSLLLQGEGAATEEELRALWVSSKEETLRWESQRLEAKEKLESLQSAYRRWETYDLLRQSVARREEAITRLKEESLFLAPLQEKVNQWERTQSLRDEECRLRQLEKELSQLEGRTKMAQQEYEETLEVVKVAQSTFTEIDAEGEVQEGRKERLRQWEQLESEVATYGKDKKDRDGWHRTWQEAVERGAQLEKQWRLDEVELARKEERLAQLEQEASYEERVDELRNWWQEWERYCKDVIHRLEAMDALEQSLKDGAARMDVIQCELASHRKQKAILQDYQRLALAYNLSMELQEGEPCPVCGSVEHPMMAVQPEQVVTDAELDEWDDKVLKGEQELATWKVRYEGWQSEWSGLEALQGEWIRRWDEEEGRWNAYKDIGSVCPNVTESAWSASSEDVSREAVLKRRQTLVQTLEQWMKGVEEEKRRVLQEKVDLLGVIGATKETWNQSVLERREWEQREKEFHKQEQALLAALRMPVEVYEKALEDLRQSLKAWQEQWEQAKRALADAEEKQHRQEGIVSALMEEQVTKGRCCEERAKAWADMLRNHRLDQVAYESIKAYEVSIEEWKRTLNDCSERLKEETLLWDNEHKQLQAYDGAPKQVDLEELELEGERYESVMSQAGAAGVMETRLQTAVQRLDVLLEAGAEERKKRQFIHGLADMANGGSTGIRGLTFELYVMGAILEDVLQAANLRLEQMSRGRYVLRRDEVENGGRGYRGLDLAVFDAYTGRVRPANTLSGGESFLASLSLAMGLADVIQAYAGGVHLDMMCIDEGFGTLDSDALDVAMETLLELQDHGRLVGIISHVAELKSRIPAQLVVKRKERGSEAYFHGV